MSGSGQTPAFTLRPAFDEGEPGPRASGGLGRICTSLGETGTWESRWAGIWHPDGRGRQRQAALGTHAEGSPVDPGKPPSHQATRPTQPALFLFGHLQVTNAT